MKCPKCGSEVRPSRKYPGYYLCDTCRKRYPKSAIIDDKPEVDHDFSKIDDRNDTEVSRPSSSKSSVRRKKKKKKSILPKLILLIVVILIAVLAIAYASGVFEGKGGKKNNTSNAADGSDKAAEYQVGETADLDDIKVKVLGYEESSGDDWAAPADGNEFVFVNMEIINGTKDDITVSSMASFENYCGDTKLDYSSNAFTALATNTDKQQMDGSIAAGKSLNGYLCLEVPVDWETLTVHYADNVWSNAKVQFKITR